MIFGIVWQTSTFCSKKKKKRNFKELKNYIHNSQLFKLLLLLIKNYKMSRENNGLLYKQFEGLCEKWVSEYI